MNKLSHFFLLLLPVLLIMSSCNGQSNAAKNKTPMPTNNASTGKVSGNYQEGADYTTFQRIRILDKAGFQQPAEAYSLLLPKGWTQESNVMWNMPGSGCDGTFKWLRAKSPDSKYNFDIYPEMLFSWVTDPQLLQFYQQNPSRSPSCQLGQPVDAEQYLRNIFAPGDLHNVRITKVEPNADIIREMAASQQKQKAELMNYGASSVQFHNSAINATVNWSDGSEGQVLIAVTVIETALPNVYTGAVNRSYTTAVTRRIVYRYPSAEKANAQYVLGVMMGSYRSNPAWNDMVNNFWRDVRQKKQVAHIGKLKMMDEQTRAMAQAGAKRSADLKAYGDGIIAKGNERLNQMDMDLRSWEQRQSSQNRMHTNFIKTIREVENYQDASGKVELSSGYNHAWSRGDGSTFIMSNNSNFNPSSVFQDQNWKEMKKVD